jgi:hypothetical protein
LLFNQHTDFESGSASNSNSTSPWVTACEPATEPSCVDAPLHEHFPFGLCNASRAHAEALIAHWACKEITSDYASDSNPGSGYYSDSSYEFDFGSDPNEPESENPMTEQPLSGPATGLVITSTPASRFVYWRDRKPTYLTDGNSCYDAYLDSIPFQEGTPLAPTEEHTPNKVASTNSSLSTPDRQVFMAAGETPGPSGTRPDRYFEDIYVDELSANAPADETNDDKNAQCERNRKRNERRRHLRECLPVRNLAEALNQFANRVHTTPEQCLMSISTIARQAQGIRAGEVIAKLAEDAYFMRVDNRVTQAPPPELTNTRTMKLQVAVQRIMNATVLEENSPRTPTVPGHQLEDLLWVVTVLAAPVVVAALLVMVMLVAEAAAAGAPHTGLEEEPVVEAITEAETTQTAMSLAPHAVAMMPAAELKKYGATSPP